MIKVEDLVVGVAYAGEGRNFDVGIWTGEAFAGLRYKFGNHFIDKEMHWDTCEHHGTFKPERELK
jgi:hypothetical protein